MSVQNPHRLVSALALFLATFSTHAQLVLTNFSQANPIKIMAAGDSITDDRIYNGAWRLYLQPLLETNGYPFTFVGRQTSIATNSFTKLKHEGYSSAVIAAPGVAGGTVHGYAATNVYLQKIVRDALTNVTPDLLLVFIGVNDMGRGRNPYTVATNDMAAFLDMVFSNAPTVNVILSKPTSIQDANIGTPVYGTYATNVPIYNAALQALVNQRRALGQRVWLADLFSAVDDNMFNTDHVHPNLTGVEAVAREWLPRIQAISLATNRVVSTLIYGGSTWKYSDTGIDLGTNWAQLDYDDSIWSNGTARLGYGLSGIVTTNSYGGSPSAKHITTYFRRSFVVPANVVFTNLNFRLSCAHGAVVWVNGQEAYRVNLPAGNIAFTNRALSLVSNYAPYIFQPTNLTAASLKTGTNVVTVEVHLNQPNNTSMGFDLELLASGVPQEPPPRLAIAVSNNVCQLNWPEAGSSGYTLHSTTDLSSTLGWTADTTPSQTNAGTIEVTQPLDAEARFYRLQHGP